MDKLLLALEYLLRFIWEHLGGIQNITMEELLEFQEYLLFKEMLENSLSLDADFVNHSLKFDNERDVTGKLLIASWI